MNFTEVRGYNAYAQFSARIREAVKAREADAQNAPEAEEDYSRSVYSEPVDTVSISKPARNASAMLTALISEKQAQVKEQKESSPLVTFGENTPYTQFRDWLRTAGSGNYSGTMAGRFTHKVPGSVMNDALRGSGIAVEKDDEFKINIDILSNITVSSRNAEKAKAIQDLLSSTPSHINWGLLLATLPPM